MSVKHVNDKPQITQQSNDTAELIRTQAVLSETLEELYKLRRENESLNRACSQERERKTFLNSEAYRLKHENKSLKNTEKQLKRQLDYQRQQYQELANSKLGRFTLEYWAWKDAGGKGFIFFLFSWLINYLFGRKNRVAENSTNATQKLSTDHRNVSDKSCNDTSYDPDMSTPQILNMTPEQEKWIEKYLDKLALIPDSNGCRFYEKLPYRIGLVCDEFFYESVSAAADFVYLTPDNWRSELDKGLDVMLFVSVWRGLNQEWHGLAALSSLHMNPKHACALELLDACKERNIPTVFYSKEDPPNYEVFLEYARRCDHIFTSARECIPYYQEDCGREHVEAVCFGINPRLHNPIGFRMSEKEDTVLFSGSWMLKYPDRCQELSVIFDGILASGHGLHIIDRNYPAHKKFAFPDTYFSYSSPAISHDELQKVHKLFDWAVNINSVKGSETMFANRCFELQANGVLLLSNFSVGVNSILPNVQMVQDASEVADILDCMTAEELYERQIAGIRSVMSGHTCFDRIAQLLAPSGLATEQPTRRILVLADRLTDTVKESFACQTYPEKELLEADKVTADKLAEFDMVAWFAADAVYETFYLEDMSNGFKYTACDYITKDAWMEGETLHEGIEHNYVQHVGSKYRTLFWREAFAGDFLLTVSDEMDLENGYSIDHFNYNAAVPTREEHGEKYLLTVVVPVYNNGTHLYGKCFASLRRSSLFKNMEIILVDDGSTDQRTLKIEEYLEQHYSNVRSFRFGDGGSGSASRPRNKGVELATAPYLTFLDPDNEAVCDGYAKLYEIAINEDRDLVLGNIYKCETKVRLLDYYNIITQAAGNNTFDEGFGDDLRHVCLTSVSIQAMVIRTEIIRANALEQVPGAAGQDTLFSWQLLHTAKRIRVLNLPIHIYYAQTAGSVTNVIRPSYFRKLLVLQKPKADWLNSVGLMDSFMDKRFNYYTTHWVLRRLGQCSAEDELECAALVEQALDFFVPYYHNSDPLINKFLEHCRSKDYTAAVACARKAFPMHKVRPMPTLDEVLKNSKRPAKMKVVYSQKENNFTFANQSGTDTSSYAWMILNTAGIFQKVQATKYTPENDVTFDFSSLADGGYKVRAFMLNKDNKISDDVAFIRVENGVAELKHALSNAIKAEG